MKKILVLGGGGFIGGHLAKKMKQHGNFVRIADIKPHEYFKRKEMCDEFFLGDLKKSVFVEKVFRLNDNESFDEVYQFAADMGGAGYIFTGEHDADVMSNSALINLNVAIEATKTKAKKVFYSSSACIYPEYNQLDPDNPNCEESSAYPANPDSEYGWEKLFSERLYLSYKRNYGLNVKVARFHNVFGSFGTWKGGKEKAPAAMCRKVAEAKNGDKIEVWGDGKQTRSFLHIDECLDAIERFMNSDFEGPINIGSEEMISINDLARMVIEISGKEVGVDNLFGEEFENKYGHKCPQGVRGRCSNNDLFEEKTGWKPSEPLVNGIKNTYLWIEKQLKK